MRSTSTPTGDDQRVLDALRAGDEAVFASLVECHGATMKRVARAYVATESVAEEVVQDAWLAVLAGLDSFQGRSSLKTWIFQILVNRARTRGAREHRCLPFSSLPSAGEDGDRAAPDDWFIAPAAPGRTGWWAQPPRPWQQPQERLEALETREELRSALARLPTAQQLVVSLRDVEGLSCDEVCDVLDISPGNQRVLLHRGRTRLRAALDRNLTGGVAIPA